MNTQYWTHWDKENMVNIVQTTFSIAFSWKKCLAHHYDVTKWKHFPRYWPFVRVNHRSPMNSSHKGQWRGALVFFFICAWINGWVNNREAGDLRRHRAQYDVTVMCGESFHVMTSHAERISRHIYSVRIRKFLKADNVNHTPDGQIHSMKSLLYRHDRW